MSGKKILRASLLILAVFMLFLSACTSPRTTLESSIISSKTPAGYTTTTVSASSVSSPPLRVYLTFSKYPVLNEPLYITCWISSTDNAPNSTAQIKLTEGIRLLGGNLEWQGDLIKDYEKHFTAQIVFNESGNQTVEAIASHILDDNNSWHVQDTISLYFGPDGVLSSTLDDWRINRYAVIETDL
jgi:hypothetical protein